MVFRDHCNCLLFISVIELQLESIMPNSLLMIKLFYFNYDGIITFLTIVNVPIYFLLSSGSLYNSEISALTYQTSLDWGGAYSINSIYPVHTSNLSLD